jgi:hypothetical protein
LERHGRRSFLAVDHGVKEPWWKVRFLGTLREGKPAGEYIPLLDVEKIVLGPFDLMGLVVI